MAIVDRDGRFLGSRAGSHVGGGKIAIALAGSAILAILAIGMGALRSVTVRSRR